MRTWLPQNVALMTTAGSAISRRGLGTSLAVSAEHAKGPMTDGGVGTEEPTKKGAGKNAAAVGSWRGGHTPRISHETMR